MLHCKHPLLIAFRNGLPLSMAQDDASLSIIQLLLRDFAAMTHSAPNVLERFLRYVQFDTQSDETSAAAPSTAKQLKLAEALTDELHQLGPVPCANACPQGAIQVDPKTGARVVVKERCIGCHLCEKACPWDMMSFDDEENKASKCFLCNGDPKCVKACPAAAIRYIPWTDRSHEEARRVPHGYLARENAAECSICHR